MQIAYAADNIILQVPYNEPESYLTEAGTDGMNLDMTNLLGLRALSHTDAMTGDTVFKTAVIGNLTTTGKSVLGGTLPIPFTIGGLLAMDVYFAYGDSSALTMAQSLWNLVFPSQVQLDQASLGHLPSLDTSFSPSCNSESVAGAVLGVYNGPSLVQISSLSPGSAVEIAASDVGSFLALSSYLYKATQNATYLSSAGLSAQFVQKHLANAEVVLAGIDIASCVSNSTEWPGDTGFVLEGLATLSASKSTTYDSFMRSLISTTISFSSWTGSDGILTADARVESENVANVKLTTPEYIRGLHEAWASMDSQDPAALYIQSFFMVQYNALLNLASADNTYSLNWHGPAPTQIDSIGQTAALDLLNAAIAVGLPDTTSNPGSSNSSTSPSNPNSPNSPGNPSDPSDPNSSSDPSNPSSPNNPSNSTSSSNSTGNTSTNGSSGNNTNSTNSSSSSGSGNGNGKGNGNSTINSANKAPTSATSSTSIPSSGPSVPTPPPRSHARSLIGPIVGAVAALLLLASLIFWWRRKANNAKQASSHSIIDTTTVPYTEEQLRPYMSAADRKDESYRNMTAAVDPFTSPPANATANEMRELDHDVEGATLPGPTEAQQPSQPAPRSDLESGAETDDIGAVPGLVDRLNRIMARLPPGGVIEEEPPAYHTA